MRLNKYVALASGLSRRAADQAITLGQVRVNDSSVEVGYDVKPGDSVRLHGKLLQLPPAVTTILFHKPLHYVTSRNGQGNKTIHELLPKKYASLKPVGRLDKDTTGLLLLTNDGQLANQLTHPKYEKAKVYQVVLDHELTIEDQQHIIKGLPVEEYISRMKVAHLQRTEYLVQLTQGHNRQIRKTFAALGYSVIKLHRTTFGPYHLGNIKVGQFEVLP